MNFGNLNNFLELNRIIKFIKWKRLHSAVLEFGPRSSCLQTDDLLGLAQPWPRLPELACARRARGAEAARGHRVLEQHGVCSSPARWWMRSIPAGGSSVDGTRGTCRATSRRWRWLHAERVDGGELLQWATTVIEGVLQHTVDPGKVRR
jgi:hypothetical protein